MDYRGFSDRREPAAFGSPVVDPAGWFAEEVSNSNEWIYEFSQTEIDELSKALHRASQNDANIMNLNRSDFDLPTLSLQLAKIREDLLYGRGFVLFRGLPVEKFGKLGSALAFWAIGQYLGDGVLSQNKHGHVLGHVTDLGETRKNHAQRGPYSREEIPFHVDCCDIVGLLSMQTAMRGGESSLVSSVTVHNEMLKRWPELVEILYEPFYRDRREEIPPGMKPWYRLAVFHMYQGYFSASVEPTYMGSVHRFDDVPEMSDLQKEAISKLQSLSKELRFDTGFKQGDMQFCNNHVIFHTRLAYEDDLSSSKKRHLLRIWLKALDGRPLPFAFYERHSTNKKLDRPGGIIGENTVLNAPI